jgi:hypothetical protein
MIVQLTKRGVRVTDSSGGVERLRANFARDDFVRLPRFLPKDLLDTVSREIDRSAFYERIHSGIDDNKELCMRTNTVAAGLLHLLLNCDELFDVVERVTGCGAIGYFRGRVYRVVPGCGHRDAWHSDVARRRLVAMSINLSRRPYRGGTLQLRSTKPRRALCEIPNLGLGDAILFRIGDGLEHRITDIEGVTAKTAFAGWFHSRPRFKRIVERARVRRT